MRRAPSEAAGNISGAVTVGAGGGPGAFLSPKRFSDKPGLLVIQNSLTFQSDSTYVYELQTSNSLADQVTANGVTIISGAQVSFTDLETGTLAQGTVFTAINNTAATPIAGTFCNLADGSTSPSAQHL